MIKTILVAGGAGSIGSHLCDALLARKHHVVVFDNLSTGSFSNIAQHVSNSKQFTFIDHDITRPLPDTGKMYDAIIDLASPASPADFAKLPLEILAVGSTGTRNLLNLADEHDARFLLGSTSEVYGDPLEHPQTETYCGNVDPVGPRSCYDEAKRFSEALTMAYHRKYGTSVSIIRIFNTYGPRMKPDDGRVLTNFITQALTNKPITLYGDGTQTRSFCYVTDLVEGMLAVLDNNVQGPVNIGNPDERSIKLTAEIVRGITHSNSKIIKTPLPPQRYGDPKQRCPDITLLTSSTGWQPTTSLTTGLRYMVEGIKSQTH